MKKQNKDQLMLNFDVAKANLLIATDEFVAACVNISEASSVPKEQKTKIKGVVKLTECEIRDRVNRVVKVRARNARLHWREIWNLIYSRLRARIGFDAISNGIAKGYRPLDAVCRANLGIELLDIAKSI